MTRPIFIAVPAGYMETLSSLEFRERYAVRSVQRHYRESLGLIREYLVCMFYTREDAMAFILATGGEEITYYDYD